MNIQGVTAEPTLNERNVKQQRQYPNYRCVCVFSTLASVAPIFKTGKGFWGGLWERVLIGRNWKGTD